MFVEPAQLAEDGGRHQARRAAHRKDLARFGGRGGRRAVVPLERAAPPQQPVAGAVVRHHGSGTLGRASQFAVFHGQRNLEWMYLKNTPGDLLVRTLPGHLVYTAAAAVHFARHGLFFTFLRAKTAALARLPDVLRKRAAVQRARRVGAEAIRPLLETRWLATKLQEKRFDAGLVRGRR